MIVMSSRPHRLRASPAIAGGCSLCFASSYVLVIVRAVQAKGFNSVEASLVASLAPDFLNGDNQYYCETCACKQDALRQQVLRALPPYLCLSLQRFYYNMRTGDKVRGQRGRQQWNESLICTDAVCRSCSRRGEGGWSVRAAGQRPTGEGNMMGSWAKRTGSALPRGDSGFNYI